jgi:hypothetical protein
MRIMHFTAPLIINSAAYLDYMPALQQLGAQLMEADKRTDRGLITKPRDFAAPVIINSAYMHTLQQLGDELIDADEHTSSTDSLPLVERAIFIPE